MIEKISYRFLAVICIGLLLLGGALGWLSFLLLGDLAANTQVVVISQAAIARFERQRVKATNEDMFFGRPDEAIKLIEQAGKLYEQRHIKVVFASDDSGNCKGGTGVSEAVHKAVIEAQKKSTAATESIISRAGK